MRACVRACVCACVRVCVWGVGTYTRRNETLPGLPCIALRATKQGCLWRLRLQALHRRYHAAPPQLPRSATYGVATGLVTWIGIDCLDCSPLSEKATVTEL